jgi:hypothetical protein
MLFATVLPSACQPVKVYLSSSPSSPSASASSLASDDAPLPSEDAPLPSEDASAAPHDPPSAADDDESERPLVATEPLYYLGVDFTHATLYDPSFQYGDLVNGKIPSWSRRTLEDLIEAEDFRMPIESDLATSAARNTTVKTAALLDHPASDQPGELDRATVRKEITPYVDERHHGYALLFIVEQISKPTVLAHYLVFDRRDGEIILMQRAMGRTSGFGPHDFYLNGLKDVADKACRNVNALVR